MVSGASLNPCVEQDEVLFQVRYCFGGYWDGLRLDALISVELNPSQPTVSGDVLILLPDRLVSGVLSQSRTLAARELPLMCRSLDKHRGH